MSEENKPAPSGASGEKKQVQPAEIVAAIRSESAATKLITGAELGKRFPDTDIPATLARAEGAADIMYIEGSKGLYYFSTESMTESYATHMARVAENDPLRLVADTVRDNSRIYPRTTDVREFANPPFLMAPWTIKDIAAKLAKNPEFSDIKSCTASNGAVYLYSTKYIEKTYAEGLTEWVEVGLPQNP